jgi:hypothetical protein
MTTTTVAISRTITPAPAAPRIRTSAIPGGSARLHATRERYLDHVEKHFASAEALAAVGFVADGVGAVPEFATDRALVRALRADPGDARAQRVLAAYARCATATLDEANSLGWVASPRPGTTIAFATSGLLAVVDGGVLRTMFFPALESTEERADRLGLSAHELAAERRRESAWTPEERHYYRVFRPAIQLIRSMPDDAVVGECSQYGALKRVLPAARALRFEGWCSHRARSAHARRCMEGSLE